MGSRSLLGRLSPRREQPILPLHKSPKRAPSEYQLSTLDPRPDDASSVDGDLPKAWLDEYDEPSASRGLSPNSWRDTASTTMSTSKMKPHPMFAGPPPPITASMLIMKDPVRVDPAAGRPVRYRNTPHSLLGGSPTEANSLLLEHRRKDAARNSDSIWRGFVRQEKALEKEVQVLLDQQAVALTAGSGTGNDASSTGSSTPTGTFYSTKSYKSRAALSLYIPPKVTRDGNVIPTRQPANDQPPGLKSTREDLRKLIASMTSLKHDEIAHIEDALNQRTSALRHLDRLSAKKYKLEEELQNLAENSEEPLARELQVLDTEHHALGEEIQLLEAKLARMRTRHRLLRDKMDNIRNKREAGLSGYYGALNEVTSEARGFVQQPPIQPLDPDLLQYGGEAEGDLAGSGGAEFMRLIPERRTMIMAQSWWTAEIEVLKRCKEHLNENRQALEEGGQVWGKVTQLVSKFESDLRQAMKSGTISPSVKGKEKMLSQEEIISDQLSRMKEVIEELEKYMQQSEEKNWNLLICAIGAELEAFKDGYHALESMANAPEETPPSDDEDASADAEPNGQSTQEADHPVDEESDNEVPPDLFGGPHPDHHEDDEHNSAEGADGGTLRRYDSENEVPPEFLVEHV
ncbi:hypothetical protein GGI43DRAFT_231132 [Trichoderma evansii]